MSKKTIRVFSREFKLKIVRRMLAGENVSALAREVKVLRKDLYAWRKRFRSGGPEALRGRGRPPKAVAAVATRSAPAKSAAAAPDASSKRIAELERKIGQQQVELDFFSASLAASRGSAPAERRVWRVAVYAVIEAMTTSLPQGELTIERMCALVGVSRAGYYRAWAASAPRAEETGLRDAIQRAAIDNRHYGYRRITIEIGREGWSVNHKRVLRLMRQDNLLCLRRRSFVPATTDSDHGWRVVPNLARHMVPTGLDQLWVADITYIRLQEEFAYLAIVLDAFSRRVVGWALATHLQASLAIEALAMALVSRKPAPGTLIHHSDSYWMKASFRAA